MAPPIKLAHVVWRTRQLPAMVDWYCRALEAEIVFGNDDLVFITYDDEHHRMAFLRIDTLVDRPAESVGLEHVAFTFEHLDDLLDRFEELRANRIEPVWAINHGPTTSLYYADPDTNRVELQIDNYPERAELNDWFRTGAFRANPIGVEFDPDELIAARRRGVPAARLRHRPDTPAEFVETHSSG